MTLNPKDLHAKSEIASVFPTSEVEAMLTLLNLVPIVETLELWQAADAAERHPGGRRPALNYRALLVACLLIWKERTPFHTTELGNLFWRRLNDESRELLGIAHVRITEDHQREAKFWHDRADRQLHRMLDLLDPSPAQRQLMNAAERRYQLSLRDDGDSALKQDRLDWFVNQLLEMTIRALPPEVRAAWKGDVSVDQTKIPAVSSRGRPSWKKADKAKGMPEPEQVIMEMDANWYRHKPAFRNKDDGDRDATWGYAANIAVATRHDPKHADIPLLAVAYTIGIPNNDELPEKTVAMLASLSERGHPAGRVTGDKEYFAIQLPERLAMRVRALGYSPLTGYRSTELGVNGNVGGAVQIEGAHYCPAIPARLRDASKRHEAKEISDEVYFKQIEEQRPLWRVHIKEQPDETGRYTIKCPAYGVGATVDCPLRSIHPKASSRVTRPEAVPPPEHKRDRICRQTSVVVPPDPETMRYLQDVPYMSRKWSELHGHDRSQIESYNGNIKDGSKEAIEDTSRRRHRGYTAASVSVAFALVSANLRLTRAWLRRQAEVPVARQKRNTKPYSPVSLKNYTPRLPMLKPDGAIMTAEEWEVVRATTIAERTAAAEARANKSEPAA